MKAYEYNIAHFSDRFYLSDMADSQIPNLTSESRAGRPWPWNSFETVSIVSNGKSRAQESPVPSPEMPTAARLHYLSADETKSKKLKTSSQVYQFIGHPISSQQAQPIPTQFPMSREQFLYPS